MPITPTTVATCPLPNGCGKQARGLRAITKEFGTRCEGRFPTPQSLCRECRSADARRRRLAKAKVAASPKPKNGKRLTLKEQYQKKTGDTRKRSVQHMRKALGLA